MKDIFEYGHWRRAHREQSCMASHNKRTEWESIKLLGSKHKEVIFPVM